MKETILSYLPPEHREHLYYYPTLPSTNTEAKALARQGAAHGTAVVAAMQTGGRGRMGRSFISPEGSVYLSVILRPQLPAQDLMHLTCAAAVAAVNAIAAVTGIQPGIKWINDLVLNGKKLGGILTELSIDPKTQLAEFAIIGIGINCVQVPPEVADMATCLDIDPAILCARLIEELSRMDLANKAAMLASYRSHCITLGQQVKIMGSKAQGKALDVDENGGLLIKLTDGSQITVDSGEVSVRGLYGYV